MRQQAAVIMGGAHAGLPTIEAAHLAGLESVVVDRDPGSPGHAIATYSVVEDRNDATAIIAACLSIRGVEFKALYCGIDLGVVPASVASALGIPFASQASAVTALDKVLAKRHFVQTPTPSASEVSPKEDHQSVLSRLRPPLVLKVPRSSGSRGVVIARDEVALAGAVAQLRQEYPGQSLLAESLVEGSMHDVNGMLIDGRFTPLGIFDREFFEGSAVSNRAFYPSSLDTSLRAEAYAATELAGRELGLDNCPVKSDLVMGPTGIEVLEVAPRFHGSIQTCQLQIVGSGFNPFEHYFRSVSGQAGTLMSDADQPMTHSAWVSLPAEPGRIVSFPTDAEVRAQAGVIEYLRYRRVGDRILGAGDNTDIGAVVVVRGTSRSETEQMCDHVVRRFRVRTVPLEDDS